MIRKIVLGILTLLTVSSFSQNNLSLEESKILAIENNIAIKNSALETEAAIETKSEAATNYFPKVSGFVGGMYAIDPIVNIEMEGGDLPIYDGNPANLPLATEFAYFPGVSMGLMQKGAIGMINILQPVYVGGKLNTGNKLAQLNVDVKTAQELLVLNEILLKTEKQYWLLVSLNEKQKTLNKYEKLLNGVYKQANDAYKAGLIIKNDLLKVQLKQSELEINKNKLKNGKYLALIQFCQTIGIPFDDTLVFNENINIIENPNIYYVNKDIALKNRTEYNLLEKSVEAADLQLKMTRGDYLPQVAIGANGYYAHSLESTASGTMNGLLYATLSIPISDWWGGSKKLNENKIQKTIAQNNFEETKDLLGLQTEKLWIDLVQAYDLISIMEKTVIQATENVKVSNDGYKNGIVTITDLLEAQAILNEANSNLIDAKTTYAIAITSYQQVTNQ